MGTTDAERGGTGEVAPALSEQQRALIDAVKADIARRLTEVSDSAAAQIEMIQSQAKMVTACFEDTLAAAIVQIRGDAGLPERVDVDVDGAYGPEEIAELLAPI